MSKAYMIYLVLLGLISSCHTELLPLVIDTSSGTEHIPYIRNSLSCPSIASSAYGQQCTYYGECCQDPVRIRERLEPGTFECINIGTTQGYVVTKCPVDTPQELSNLCIQGNSESNSDVGISNWPVTGTYTGITYSNLYCAICNGALSHFTDANIPEFFDLQRALEFWTMHIYCDNSTIEDVEHEEIMFNTEALQKLLLKNQCWKVVNSTTLAPGIHKENCGKNIYKCPEEYPEDEMSELCNDGPVNEICLDGSLYPCHNGSYKNAFCQKCWVNHVFHELQPNSPQTNGTLLMAARLITQHPQNNSDFSTNSYGLPELSPDYFLALTNDNVAYILPKHLHLPETQEFWNLGSILCYSNLSTVCGELLIFPNEVEKCSEPGCGEDNIQDLSNNCTSLHAYVYNSTIAYSRMFHWADSLLAAKYSSCQHAYLPTNCRCDPRCHYFGDCCFDADLPAPPSRQPIKPFGQSDWTCYDLYSGDGSGLTVINSCPENFSDEEVALCTRGDIGKWDPFSWLVSDERTNLTYKNMYCASCNNASNLLFWDALMDCPIFSGQVMGMCDFVMYTPPSQQQNLYYPCYLDDHMVSSCPDTYKDWQLYNDCYNKPTSHLYYRNATFRNVYCAICHLGDQMEFATIFPEAASPRHTVLKTPSAPEIGEVWFYGWQVIRFSYKSNSCCGKCDEEAEEQCTVISSADSLWGNIYIPGSPGCSDVPFYTSCTTNLQQITTNRLSNTKFGYLCPGVTISCEAFKPTTMPSTCCYDNHTGNPFGSPDGASSSPGSYYQTSPSLSNPSTLAYLTTTAEVAPPGVIGGLFSLELVKKPDEQHEMSSTKEWVTTVNETFQFCSNGTIVSNTSGGGYNRILLTSGGIQVEKEIMIRSPKPAVKAQFKIYDFIIIGSSLTSILAYLIYMMVGRKKHFRLPEKMLIALLLSLFGALICFAFVTTPAGSDIIACQALAALTQFFFLATLTWSNSMAISIIRSLRSISLSRTSGSVFSYYCIYSFGLPLSCTMVTYILSLLDVEQFAGEVYETEVMCFLGEITVLSCLFLVPVYIIVVSNFVIGVIVMVKVTKSGKVGFSRDKNRSTKHIISCFKISLSLGLAWIFLFVAHFYSEFWPVMQVLVELQGLFIVTSNVIGWNCVKSVKKWGASSFASSSINTRMPRPSSSVNTTQLRESIPLSPNNPVHGTSLGVTECTS